MAHKRPDLQVFQVKNESLYHSGMDDEDDPLWKNTCFIGEK